MTDGSSEGILGGSGIRALRGGVVLRRGSGPGVSGKLFFNAPGGAGLGELVGDANAVEDGAIVGGAVADDADAAHAEQRRATVFAVVEAAAELVEGLAGEQRAHLGGDGAGERLAQHIAHKAAHALTGFEGHVADKAVADDDIGEPEKMSRPSTLPMKLMGRALSRGRPRG